MSHTTHFDDCGCLTARYEARIAELEQREREFDKLHAVQVARVEILIGEKATLEAELAASRQDAQLAWAEAAMGPTEAAITHELAQSQAHANTLRDALEKCDCETLTNGMGEYEGHDPKCVRCAALAAAEANLATFGMVELAVRNPNVSSYITEWEGRALRAEAKLADERRHVADLALALEETRCTCEAVVLGGMPSRLRCVRCRTLEAHAAAIRARSEGGKA